MYMHITVYTNTNQLSKVCTTHTRNTQKMILLAFFSSKIHIHIHTNILYIYCIYTYSLPPRDKRKHVILQLQLKEMELILGTLYIVG